jgi:hypothetical protein
MALKYLRNLHSSISNLLIECLSISFKNYWIEKYALSYFQGLQQQEFHGIPATNRKFETLGVIIFRFEGPRIKEAWSIVDGLTPAIELGLVKTNF